MASKAKPIDTKLAQEMYERGNTVVEIAQHFGVFSRRVEVLLGLEPAPQQDSKTEEVETPLFTVELRIAYTEVQLDEAIADFTAEEKAHALGHVMFLRAGG